MKKIFSILLTVIVVFTSFSCSRHNPSSAIKEKPYCFGWLATRGSEDYGKYLKGATELNFKALTSRYKPAQLNDLIKDASKVGIDIYYVIYPAAPKEEHQKYLQVMSEEEEKLAIKSKDKKYRLESRFQWGGEPLPGNIEVLHQKRIPCFHRKEVIAQTKKNVKEIIEACPGLAGIAFDKFGYHNYRCCYCDESERKLVDFRKKNPGLSLEEAREKFSFTTLVGFYNEIADYARSLKPGFKTAAHVWPVFLPEPLYGNRLDIDYCHQTVAWFFKPYWSDEKIMRYTNETINNDNEYFQRQIGLPFVAIYWDMPEGLNKDAKRFKHDLNVVFSATPHRRLAIASMRSVINSPDHFNAMKNIFIKYGIVASKNGK